MAHALLPESVFLIWRSSLFAEVAELSKAGLRALDLTYLNMDRYLDPASLRTFICDG